MQSLAAAASGGYCHIWLLLRLAAFVFGRDSFSSHSTSCVSSFTEGLENRWSVSKSPYVGFVQQLSASTQTFYCFGFSPRTWQGFTSSLAADLLSISCAAACRASSLAADSLSIFCAAACRASLTGLLCLTPAMYFIAFRGEGNSLSLLT